MQSDTLPVNPDRVAVDDRRDADEGGCAFHRWDRWPRSYGRRTTGSRQECHKERMPNCRTARSPSVFLLRRVGPFALVRHVRAPEMIQQRSEQGTSSR
jgi:hypothetical protein